MFTKNDENFVEAFAIFCGMGIHNTHMYEKAIVAMAKQSVTLEVLSYHASASTDDAVRLMVSFLFIMMTCVMLTEKHSLLCSTASQNTIISIFSTPRLRF